MNVGCDAPGSIIRMMPATFARLCSDQNLRMLRDMQYEYNRMLNKRDKMYYNRDDVEFIQKTSTDHATALDSKIDQITQHLANLGKQLYDLKKTRESVQSLLSKSAEYLEEDDD